METIKKPNTGGWKTGRPTLMERGVCHRGHKMEGDNVQVVHQKSIKGKNIEYTQYRCRECHRLNDISYRERAKDNPKIRSRTRVPRASLGFTKGDHEIELSCHHKNYYPSPCPEPDDVVFCSRCSGYRDVLINPVWRGYTW